MAIPLIENVSEFYGDVLMAKTASIDGAFVYISCLPGIGHRHIVRDGRTVKASSGTLAVGLVVPEVGTLDMIFDAINLDSPLKGERGLRSILTPSDMGVVHVYKPMLGFIPEPDCTVTGRYPCYHKEVLLNGAGNLFDHGLSRTLVVALRRIFDDAITEMGSDPYSSLFKR